MTLTPNLGEHGTVFVTGRDQGADMVPSVVLASEHYNMVVRLLAAGVPVKLSVDLQTRYFEQDKNAYNVIAEIRGTDPQIGDEIVMAGAHLDSWHTGTGATDNADGCAVAIEALRILKAVGVKPRRTIRIALWGGEEQGLLGSKEYVKRHLTDDAGIDTRGEYFLAKGRCHGQIAGQLRSRRHPGASLAAATLRAYPHAAFARRHRQRRHRGAGRRRRRGPEHAPRGRKLGAGAASLYWHVPSKAALIDLILDRVGGELELPEPDPSRWQEQMKEVMRSMRAVLTRHRDLARLSLGRVPWAPTSCARWSGSWRSCAAPACRTASRGSLPTL